MRDARDELVRIDDQGTAHPIGTVASQRMRARRGAFRLLPGPPHVVFMRYTGEDGRRDDEDGAIVRLAGEIATPGSMCDILALLGQTGWRGELVALDKETSRSVYFDQGSVVGVWTNEPGERLGQVMYKFGALTREQLDACEQTNGEGRRFGEVVTGHGFLKQSQIYEYLNRQVQEVVFAMLTLGDGTFFFLDGFEESALVSRHTVSANVLLMDAVTRLDELRYFREKIPNSAYVPVRREGRGPPPPEFSRVFDAIDGFATVEDIGRITALGEFDTTKVLYTLLQSKHIVMHPPRVSGGAAALVGTANSVLRMAFDAARRVDAVDALRSELSSFAVGAGVYDILFRDAGPDAAGQLDPKAVAQNSVLVASAVESELVLKQMLHDYVSFALFSAATLGGREIEGELMRAVEEPLSQLRPQGP